MPLQLNSFLHPIYQEPVFVYLDWETALRHLRDHLLTAPECYAWSLLCPEIHAILTPEESDDRWSFQREAERSQGATAQGLYDIYVTFLQRVLWEAHHAGWFLEAERSASLTSSPSVLYALSPSGVFAIVERSFESSSFLLKTAYIPGQGDRLRLLQMDFSQRTLLGQGLPREGAVSPAPPQDDFRDILRRQKREARWSVEQTIFYRIFRPALTFLRNRTPDIQDPISRYHEGSIYLEFKRLLPRSSQFSLEGWLSLRADLQSEWLRAGF